MTPAGGDHADAHQPGGLFQAKARLLDDHDGQYQRDGENADVLKPQQQGGPERRNIINAIEEIRRLGNHSLTFPFHGLPSGCAAAHTDKLGPLPFADPGPPPFHKAMPVRR